MSFVQIIEFTTDDIDAVRKLDEEWQRATEGKRTARRQILARDRSRPNHYMTLVFFDSYGSAMENSRLPGTQEVAEKYRAATQDVRFHDLDILSEEEL